MAYNSLNIDDFNDLVKRFESKNRCFTERHFGNVKSVFYGNNVIAKTKPLSIDLTGLSSKSFNLFILQFNKRLYRSFCKNPELHDLIIHSKNNCFSAKNKELFNALPRGEDLYEFDIKSAYWQIGHKLGYIDKKTFDKYFMNDDYKMAKRLCFSFLAREKKIVIHNESKHEIRCENAILRQVYDNVRIELNNIIHEVLKDCTVCYKYNTDAMFVDLFNTHKISKALQQFGLKYNFRVWEKINDSEIKSCGKIKKF